jgi:glutamyl/glutaminyl-tRNA synthetase
MLRVRFAPSPAGYLHIGSARTFISNSLYARYQGGTMILRIDDTAIARNARQSLDSIFDGLNWLELSWDEESGMRELPAAKNDRRVPAGENFVWRFRVPGDSRRDVRFRDMVYGDQGKEIADIEDFALLRELAVRLGAAPEFTEQSVESELRRLAEERGVKAGLLINAARPALTGQSVGPTTPSQPSAASWSAYKKSDAQ